MTYLAVDMLSCLAHMPKQVDEQLWTAKPIKSEPISSAKLLLKDIEFSDSHKPLFNIYPCTPKPFFKKHVSLI